MHLNPLAGPVAVCGAVLYIVGMALEKKAVSHQARVLLFVISIAIGLPGLCFAFYYTHLFDNFVWFYRLRALPYSELLISGSGLLAGVVHSWFSPETFGERVVFPAALTVLIGIPFIKPALDPIDLDRLRNQCVGEICMQSTFSTCGPSSSATILKSLGQNSSEAELARECFTSRGGTEIWYIARAFERRGYRASVQIQALNSLSPPSPAIAGVVLPGGAGHFIAILGQTDKDVIIGDPMKGKLVVKKADLNGYYRFTGFFLVIQPK